MEVAGRKAGLSEQAIATALDPTAAVAARTIVGGTAPGEVRRMVARMTGQLDEDASRIAAWRTGLARAEAMRHAAVRALAGRSSD